MTDLTETPTDPQAALEAAVKAGDAFAAVEAAIAAGTDPAAAHTRVWNMIAGYGDVDHHLDLNAVKAIEAGYARKAVDACLADHSGKRSCDHFLHYWYGAGGPTHNRDLPEAVADVVERKALTDAEARVAVGMAWKLPEWPEQLMATNRWRRLFRTVGFLDDELDDDEPAVRPTGTLTLYRGSTAALRRGMAWTGDLDRATWFARRWDGMDFDDGTARVWAAQVEPRRLLARFTGRGEDEYVLDTRSLRVTEHH